MAFTFCVKLCDNIYIKIYVKNIMIIIITIMIRGDACMTLTLKEGRGEGGGLRQK